jgi:hypothetical protein
MSTVGVAAKGVMIMGRNMEKTVYANFLERDYYNYRVPEVTT